MKASNDDHRHAAAADYYRRHWNCAGGRYFRVVGLVLEKAMILPSAGLLPVRPAAGSDFRKATCGPALWLVKHTVQGRQPPQSNALWFYRGLYPPCTKGSIRRVEKCCGYIKLESPRRRRRGLPDGSPGSSQKHGNGFLAFTAPLSKYVARS